MCHTRCEDFYKLVQADFMEENEFSPSFIRNKSGIKDWLEGYASEGDLDEFKIQYFNSIFVIGDINNYTEVPVTIVEDMIFRYGVNNVTTLTQLPVTKQSVVATLSGNSELSLASDMHSGQSINIKIMPLVPLTVTLPSSSGWTLMDETQLDLVVGEVAEINVWCTGIEQYSLKTLVKL